MICIRSDVQSYRRRRYKIDKFVADWAAIGIRKQAGIDHNNARENKKRVQWDYSIGNQYRFYIDVVCMTVRHYVCISSHTGQIAYNLDFCFVATVTCPAGPASAFLGLLP